MCPTTTTSAFRQGEPNRLRWAFEVLDVDRDGKISYSDLRAFHEHQLGLTDSSTHRGVVGQEEADMIIRTMMCAADSNKNGYVEYGEFEEIVNGGSLLKHNNGDGGMLKVMEDAFNVMDKDGDGRLGHQDLKAYLTWAGFDAPDEDVEAMISLAADDPNPNPNGGVTF